MSELKPCPWCGSSKVEYVERPLCVVCHDCDHEGPQGTIPIAAITQWNDIPRQSDIDALKAENERLKAALRDICEEMDVTAFGESAIAKEALSISDACGRLFLTDNPATIEVYREVMGL